MADTVFNTVFPKLKAVDNGDGTYSVAVNIPGMPPLSGLTAGELLVATAATTAVWQSTGVVLSAPDISGIVTAAAALTMPAFTFGGNATLSENTNIVLDTVLSADGKYCGIVETGTAGAVLAFGELVYFAVADSKWELAKADVAATSFGKLGIVVVGGNENDTVTILLFGNVRADAKFPALTVGAPVFISAANAGLITSTAPTGTTDFVVRIIGDGNTANELFFNPDNTYLELA